MSSALSHDSSHTNRNDNERRQSRRLRQRERRQLMSQEQREATLSRRRSNYQPRRYRIAETYQNESTMNMTDVGTGTNPTNVQQTCRLRPMPNYVLPCAFELGSTSTNQNIAHGSTIVPYNEDGNSPITERQICRSDSTPSDTLPTNFEYGCISTDQQHMNHNAIFELQNVCVRPRRYHNVARNVIIPRQHAQWQLPHPIICHYCRSLLFHSETSQLCCRNGHTKLDPIPTPTELQLLFASETEEGRHFRQYIRAYNHVFSFTSLGVHIDETLATGVNGIYSFRAQGNIYHSIGSLLPHENNRPRYMQMWIVDTDHEIDNRLEENQELRRELLIKIQNILDQHNPFVHVFRQIGQRQDIPSCRLIIKQQKANQHQYCLPTTSQVAAVIVDNDDTEILNDRDIVVEGVNGRLTRIQDIAGYYDPLQYPLLLPYGTYGWDINTRNNDGTRLTCLDYYAFILQVRPNSSSLLLRGGRLLQQYVVDNYVKIETQRLQWICTNQQNIRSELYQGLHDCLDGGENNAGNVGRRIVLPTSFTGSPRDMYQRYQDAMTLVQTYGKPDLMITMTCNPNWTDIKDQLLPGQSPQDRPDLITRVFKAKFEEFKKDIVERGVLGKVLSYSYVIEYQKRGLPHVHMLVIFENNDKLRTPEDFDNVVRAEIPSQIEEPDLYKSVIHHMIHGPCGSVNPRCSCMRDGICKKKFPKPFASYTALGNDSYPIYRRRQGAPVSIPNNAQVMVDNGWVVPYNPWLLVKYDCHINVEVCGGIKSVKYIYKYIHKGPDRVALELRNGQNCDEIQQFVDGRWICAPEAFWRIFSFEFSRMYPSVIRLQIHLPNQQPITFNSRQRVSDIIANDDNSKTMLTEFFKMNRDPALAGKHLYREFPQYFRWIQSPKRWVPRTGRNKVVGRVYVVSPSEGERFYLRILLNHIRGPNCFEELMTVNGALCTTFKEAAETRGFLQRDDYVRQCLHEACSVKMPSSLRRLFVSILVFCQPTGVRELWNAFHLHMSEDYGRSTSSNNFFITNKLLLELRRLLHQHKKKLDDFDLPPISVEFLDDSPLPRIIEDELSIQIPDEDLRSIQFLNPQQSMAFDLVVQSVMNNDSNLFFIDGPGGTGKTFLYRSILAHLRRRGKIVIAVASSGIAATLLPGGRTAHSRLKIPLRPTVETLCKIEKQTDLAELIRRASAIVWDEAPMANRYAFESVSKTFQDIMDNMLPFGGKNMIFGGDFRQVLPVVKRGSTREQIAASISRSTFWNRVKIIHLQQNMRTIQDIEFSQFLLRIGDGLQYTVKDNFIELPDSIIIPWEGEQSINQLIDFVLPNLVENVNDADYMVGRAIITPKNVDVDKINDILISIFPGDEREYISWDAVEDDNNNLFQEEFLNSLSPSGLPPHRIALKVGCPIMLLRNVAPELGLCNGTSLICRCLGRNFIDAEIITGSHKGTRYFIHRMPLKSEDNSGLPFELTRRQFPIRLSFALTINKAQGQTIHNVGIFLRNHVFSHGQLYVALSRGVSQQSTKILVKDGKLQRRSGVYTKNVVYKDVLLPNNR